MASKNSCASKWANVCGKTEGIKKGNAPHPSVSKVHDSGYTYAPNAKCEYKESKGTGKKV
jgi:hypothetical protein